MLRINFASLAKYCATATVEELLHRQQSCEKIDKKIDKEFKNEKRDGASVQSSTGSKYSKKQI